MDVIHLATLPGDLWSKRIIFAERSSEISSTTIFKYYNYISKYCV